MTITALPELDRTSATFKSDVDAFFGVRFPAFVGEANALQEDVNSKQAEIAAATTDVIQESRASADSSEQSSIEAARQAALAAISASVAAAPAALMVSRYLDAFFSRVEPISASDLFAGTVVDLGVVVATKAFANEENNKRCDLSCAGGGIYDLGSL